jgi:hypothetical protein
MHDLKNLAKKANGGDKEALTILILDVPSHAMKGMEPEEFSKKMEGDDTFSEYVSGLDRPSKEEYAPEESGGYIPADEIGALLDAWTEQDPETPAGSYYQDLRSVFEKHSGSEE